MDFKSYDELIKFARLHENNIDKLRVLQEYFLQNVDYDYLQDIAMAINTNGYEINTFEKGKKTDFSSEQEKENILSEFEKKLGNNFHFSQKDRAKLLLSLGEVVQPTQSTTQLFGKTYTINNPGYDGSLFDCIRKVAKVDSEVLENGLIKYGVCRNFASFAKKFCSDLEIPCYCVTSSDNHAFNIIEIDEEKRIFDFTRMIGIRDDFYNLTGQEIDDWFNMSFQKMFEYKPNRKITEIDSKNLNQNPISNDNYTVYLSNAKSFDVDNIER